MLSNALSSLDEHEASVYGNDRPVRGVGRGGRRRPPRGHGGSGEGVRAVMISKKLSWLLRHGAAKEGVPMDEGGWVRVDHLFKWQTLRSLKVTLAELHEVVETNAKKRFEMQRVTEKSESDADTSARATPTPSLESVPMEGATLPHPDFETSDMPASSLGRLSLADPAAHKVEDPSRPEGWRIRATQGHTIETVEAAALLRPLDPEASGTPQFVVHGTTERAWTAIRSSGGLSRMGRAQVHFATGTGDAEGDAAVFAELWAARAKQEPELEAAGAEPAAGAILPIQTHGVEAAAAGITSPSDPNGAKPVVISGMRSSSTVLVWVDVRASSRTGGLQWWQSSNGVVLSSGNAQGMVPLRWVLLVERRRKHGSREVLWRPEATAP